MKEITRIHIAKTPYDIETGAKKELERYIKNLGLYADDPEVMVDVEVRMTELLSARGIQKDGVITREDIDAIRAQLGEPHDFANENSDITLGSETEPLVNTPHRLYRDTDTPVLGGVLGGIARYFGIDPLWTRLGFLILCIPSMGTLFLAYMILWLVVPPARSAAEKLQLEGKPITLASIKKLSIQESSTASARSSGAVLQKVLLYGLGVLSLIHALGALIITIWGGIVLGMSDNPVVSYTANSFIGWLVYLLFILSGILLTTLFSIIAYALFFRKYSKRVGVAIVAIIAAGILSFSSAAGLLFYDEWQRDNNIHNSRVVKNVVLPDNFTHVERLNIKAQSNNSISPVNAQIEYVVTNERPRYELTLDATTKGVAPTIAYSENNTATITINQASADKSHLSYTSFSMTVYGPAIETIAVDGNNMNVHYTNNTRQERFNAENISGNMTLTGRYTQVNVLNRHIAQTSLDDATIENLQVNIDSGRVSAGVVRSLAIEQSDVCGTGEEETSRLDVKGVSSNTLTYNGTKKTAQTISQACGDVIVAGQETNDTQTEERN